MLRIPVLTLFLFLFYYSTARAGDGDFHCPAPGTRIETSTGGHLVADSAAGFDCRMLNGPDTLTMHAGLFDARNAAENREGAERLWPLQIGKASEYTTVCATIWCIKGTRYHNRLRVAGLEGVTTRAGTFRAYRIVVDVRSFAEDDNAAGRGESYHAQSTFWWAPSVGYTVRYEWKFLGGFAYSSDHFWEVTSVGTGAIALR